MDGSSVSHTERAQNQIHDIFLPKYFFPFLGGGGVLLGLQPLEIPQARSSGCDSVG